MVFNATFSNISVISWQSVLLVGETGENHRLFEASVFDLKIVNINMTFKSVQTIHGVRQIQVQPVDIISYLRVYPWALRL